MRNNNLSIGDKIIISNRKNGNDKKLFCELYDYLSRFFNTSYEREFLWRLLMDAPQETACEIIAGVKCWKCFAISYYRNADNSIDEIGVSINHNCIYI